MQNWNRPISLYGGCGQRKICYSYMEACLRIHSCDFQPCLLLYEKMGEFITFHSIGKRKNGMYKKRKNNLYVFLPAALNGGRISKTF